MGEVAIVGVMPVEDGSRDSIIQQRQIAERARQAVIKVLWSALMRKR
jgi:hypothetical protein